MRPANFKKQVDTCRHTQTHKDTFTHAHTHARTHAQTHTHTHKNACAQKETLSGYCHKRKKESHRQRLGSLLMTKRETERGNPTPTPHYHGKNTTYMKHAHAHIHTRIYTHTHIPHTHTHTHTNRKPLCPGQTSPMSMKRGQKKLKWPLSSHSESEHHHVYYDI